MTARLVLPAPLRADAGGAHDVEVRGETLRAALDELASRLPALERRLRDERGELRQHVLVFVDGDSIAQRGGLDIALREGSEVFIAPAVSGG